MSTVRPVAAEERAMGTMAEETFRRLTIGDRAMLGSLGSEDAPRRLGLALDARDEALIRLAALIALDAPTASFRCAVEAAQRAGAREEDLLAALIAVADIVGTPKVVAAAPRIALAAGYDVEAALE